MYRAVIFIAGALIAVGCIYYGVIGVLNINTLKSSGLQVAGSAWTHPLEGLVFGGLLLLLILYLLWELAFNRVPAGTDPLSRVPRWLSETRISRRQFGLLSVSLAVLTLGIGVGAEFILGSSLASNIIDIIIVILLFVTGFFLTIFRSNDISPEAQLQLWKSGNMWLTQGWLLWLAPSSQGKSSYREVNSFLVKNGKANWSVIGHNAARWAIFFIVIFVIISGLYFLDIGLR